MVFSRGVTKDAGQLTNTIDIRDERKNRRRLRRWGIIYKDLCEHL